MTFTNLTPHASYVVEYLGSECYYQAAGKRVFSIAINNQVVEPALDLFAETGARYTAFTRSYFCTADAEGKVLVAFGRKSDCAKYGGLALFGLQSPRDPAVSYDAANGQFKVSAKEALTCTLQRSVDNVHWEDVTTVLGDGGAPVTVPAVPGSCFRVAASNGLGVVRSEPLAVSPAVAAFIISSSTMKHASRTIATFSGVTSPRHLMASAGPGKGCLSEACTPTFTTMPTARCITNWLWIT